MPIRVLLADDHHLVRAGIRALLQRMPEYQVVGEAATGNEAVRLTTTLKPDIVLLDIAMPELSGLEALTQITKHARRSRVIILSMYSTEAYVMRALRGGAAGYLLKGSFAPELDLALKAVARGQVFLSSAVSKHVIDALVRRQDSDGADGSADPYERLTHRERQVLQLIAEGLSSKEIAEKLGISAKTVKTYRTRLMQQLNLHDVAGLVRYAVRIGVVRLDE